MDAYTIGVVWGSIFIAGVPTAALSYYFITVRFKNKILGFVAIISCMINGFLGSIIFSLPTAGILILVGYFFREKSHAQS